MVPIHNFICYTVVLGWGVAAQWKVCKIVSTWDSRRHWWPICRTTYRIWYVYFRSGARFADIS